MVPHTKSQLLAVQKIIESDVLTTTFINDSVVMVRAKPEVNIGHKDAAASNKLIEDTMPGDYGMIVDRKEDYSIMPVEVFQILNNIEKLKAIAIVAHRDRTAKASSIDKLLFNGPLKIFFSIHEAKDWIEETLELSKQ